jgi:type IV pilus assembly protein PilN
VHLLDQVVRQLPDGIYLRSVKQTDTKVTLVGYAQSNARVSTLMRSIEGSPWLERPALVEIKSVQLPSGRANEFTLTLHVKRAPPPEVPQQSAPAKKAALAPRAADGAAA